MSGGMPAGHVGQAVSGGVITQSAPSGQPVGVFTPWDTLWAGVPDSLQQDPNAVILLSGNSFLHFAPSAAGAWRLRSQFDRNGYATHCQLTWSYLGLLTQYTDCSGHSTHSQEAASCECKQ